MRGTRRCHCHRKHKESHRPRRCPGPAAGERGCPRPSASRRRFHKQDALLREGRRRGPRAAFVEPGLRGRPLTSPPEAPGDGPHGCPQEKRKGEGDRTQKSGGGTGNTELRGASGSDSATRIRAAGLSAFSGLPAQRPLPPQSPPLSLALPATFSCCLKMKQQKTFSVNQGGGTAGPRPGQCTHV